MSYILDALRKSDQQRRRGGVPTLAAVPAAVAAAERPTFPFYGLLGALLIAGGMAVGWLRPWRPEPPVIAPVAANPPLSPAPQPVSVPRPEASATPEADTARHEAPSVAPRSERHRSKVPSDGASERELLARGDLPLSIQRELPAMSVAVHAYSSKPRDRLVSVNNRLLREGDSLAPDLRLEQITPDGMIFTFRGYRFRYAAQ